MNLAALVLAIAVLLGSAGAAYVKGRADGRALERDKHATELSIEVRATAAAASAAADAISKIEVKHVTIRQLAQTEIRREPIYMDCQHPDAVRRLLDSALTNSEPASAVGSGKLPETISPDR